MAAIAFSSQRKWSAVEFRHGAGDVDGSWVLGAPEFVFPDDRLAERVRDHTDRGYRTLVLAYTAARLIEEERPIELEPVALLTFSERLRVDAAETLAYFAEQGVQVRIISGDNPNTVAAIARQVGIEVDEPQDARTLPEDPEALARIASEHLVFGRVTPDQKRALVRALKASGHTVAMTGDGVNDALAIKEADMGIAMESGSAATKAVARLVLLDGKFSHLPAVVAEGRKVIANIERVSMLFFNNVVHAGVLALLMGIFLVQFPVYPRQLSVIDGLTIGVPSFFLALMPNARRYVPGFMRRSLSFALPVGVVVGVTLFTYTVVARAAGIYEDEVRTGAMLILTIAGLWVLVVIARPIDGWKILIIGVMMAATILVNTLGPIRYFLRLEDPSLRTAVYILVFSVGCIALIEIIRLIHRRYVRRILQSALSTTAR